MILSDRTIASHIDDNKIVVEPDVRPEQVQPASLDVRIGSELRYLDGSRVGDLTLEPHTPYLGHTMDYIELPDDIAAMLAGRSSVGRSGVIVHKTAGWIDPGFNGQLTLELYNFSNQPINYEPGERIGQLVFFELDTESHGYDGRYQGQRGATTSR